VKRLAARALLLAAVVALLVPAAASTAVGDDWRAFGRTPGGAFVVEQWPTELPSSAPRDVATLQIPPP